MPKDNISNKKVLVLLFVGTSSSVLGGQERRWARIVGNQELNNKHQIAVLINKNYLSLLSKSEIIWKATQNFVIPDFNNKWINAFFVNLAVVFYGMWYGVIQVPNQSLIAYPSAIILKILFRKRIIFSYTGTTIDGHEKDQKKRKYAKRVKLLANFADVTEVLNPRILLEDWPKNSNVVVAPCSFSDPNTYNYQKKINKIVFAGHLYTEKGIDVLKRLIVTGDDKGFKLCIYGTSINSNKSRRFEEWLLKKQKEKEWFKLSRPSDMSLAFADALIVLSFQSISNYPSQVILEGLLSGCHIIMSDTGDSRLFDCPGIIHVVASEITGEQLWDLIKKIAFEFSERDCDVARNYVLNKHTADRYVAHLVDLWRSV